MTHSRSRSFWPALTAAFLLLAGPAHAAQITGDPLSVASSDEAGNLGVAFTGSGTPEFFGSSVDTDTGAVRPAASAGFVVVTSDGKGNVATYGSRRGNVTPTSAPVVSGSGTAADPFRIVQTFTGGDPAAVDIRQELTYVNGQASFGAKLDVTNVSGTAFNLRAAMGADLAGGGSDTGTGVLEAGPPRFVGGFNTTVGSVAGLAEKTPWSHFEEGPYGDVLSRADSDPVTDRLRDTVDPTEVDNGAAVQWDAGAVGPGGAASYAVDWRFTRTFDLSPGVQVLTTGDPADFTVTTRSSDGQPRSGIHVRYAVAGANGATGDVRTGADGTATFEYAGAQPGGDTITAYADLNDNGQRDAGEPQRESTVTWSGLEAPHFAQNVNVRPLKGRVLVKLPKTARVNGRWARAAQNRFVRLTSQSQIPVGSEIDTVRGTIQLTSSQPTATSVQTSQFYSGRFQVLQPRSARGLTEARMTGALKCRTGSGASRSSSRRLWGHGKGRFRTRGRHSTATVRGTLWLTKDTCGATTTTVREGTVTVRDLEKRKNVTVKAGRSYVARPKKR